MQSLLEVKHLVKNYAKVEAVRGVSFAIAPGVCFGLLGPNGAGKTTTIEMIEDVVRPTAGEILYKGKPRTRLFHNVVGIQFQTTSLLNLLSVRETLKTFQSLYPRTADLDELIALCHLSEFQNQHNDKISGGQRQRFMLALALINEPELLFLDEPSTGLDPQARRNLWDLIGRIKAQGKTIILTTHYMEEAQHLCDEVAIMDYGKVVAQGSPEDLIKAYAQGMTVVLPKAHLSLSPDKFALPWRAVRDRIEIKTDDVNACIAYLISQKIDLSDMTVRSPNLENVFLNLTGRQLRD